MSFPPKLQIFAERYDVMNGNDPTHGNLTEEKESEMEEFISYARLVIGALGYKIFEPLIAPTEVVNHRNALNDEPVLFSRRKSADARGKDTQRS